MKESDVEYMALMLSSDDNLSVPNMNECMIIGISGNCGADCIVYLRGDCLEPQGIEEKLPTMYKRK